ncbi:MAG: hypothetical protein QW292_02015 [Candidatus Parvarchaeota archaeon]
MIRFLYIDDIDKELEKTLMTEVTGDMGDYIKAYNLYTNKTEEIKLSRLQRFLLSVNSCVKVEKRRYPNWTGEIPFYVYRCEIGGREQYLLDYPHGYEHKLYF